MNDDGTVRACKITVDSLNGIMQRLTGMSQAKLAYALLIIPYNGEDWYYIDDYVDLTTKFRGQIMTKEKLDELFTVVWAHDHSMWFSLVRKESHVRDSDNQGDS